VSRSTKVPSLPSPTPANSLEFAKAVKGVLDVREGLAGDPLDANVTLRELADGGIISVSRTSTGGIGSLLPVGGGDGASTLPDLTTPPAPTGLSASGALTSITLQWDSWPYSNHAFTEVWRSATTSFGAAVLIGTSSTRFYSDAVGSTGKTYYYWIRFRSMADVPGPYNSVSGTPASSGQDVGLLLSTLSGQITETQLFSSLNTRINLIDGPSTTTGTVAARVKTETDARVAALTAEAGYRSSGDATTLASAQTYAQTWSYSKSTVDSAIAAQGTSLTTAFTNADATNLTSANTYTATYAYSKSAVDSSLSSLNTSIRADFAAADSTTLASANSFTYSRATIDGAISSSASTLTAAYQAADSTTLTSAKNYTESYAYSASAGSATAGNVSTLTARLNNFNGSGVSVETSTSATASTANGLAGLYSVKMDLNGFVSGFGLQSSLITGGTPTSTFIVNVDKFALTTPTSSVANWSASTAIALNAVRGISGVNDKLLVCKVAGTTGGSAPSIAGSVGTRVIDGGVTWQIGSRVPFSSLTVPTSINGATVPAGTYIDGAYILNATINSAQIGSLAADKITAGYTTSVDLESGVFAGSEFYIGGTVTYEYSDATAPTKKTGIASVSSPNVALNTSGALFNSAYFKIYNGSTYETPFEVVGGAVKIKNAYIQDASITTAKISDTIQSTNYSSSAGWQINKSGTATFNQVSVRGELNVGAMTGWAWPAAGQSGAHLGPNGLLIGNANDNRYFYVNVNGDISAPGLTISAGSASFSGTLSANIVNTNQIVGGATSVGASATSAGASVSVTVSVPAGASAILIEYFLGPDTVTYTGGGGKDGGGGYTYGPIIAGLTDNGSTTGAIIISPSAGNHTITLSRSYYTGTMRLGVMVLKR